MRQRTKKDSKKNGLKKDRSDFADKSIKMRENYSASSAFAFFALVFLAGASAATGSSALTSSAAASGCALSADALSAFRLFAREDFLFAALFLCRIPLDAAESITETVSGKAFLLPQHLPRQELH